MDISYLEESIDVTLAEAEEGFRLENALTSRSVTVVNYPHERYQMAKGGMVSGLTNHESVAREFLTGG